MTNTAPQMPAELETTEEKTPTGPVCPIAAVPSPDAASVTQLDSVPALEPVAALTPLDTDEESEPVHQTLAPQLGGRRRRRRWDAETKAQLTIEAAKMRAEGMRWTDVAKKLNVLEGSLRKWLEDYESPKEVSSLPHDPELIARGIVDETEPGALSVVTPQGFRVEGLDLEGAHMLIEMLRA
ncbi:MAG: helix-turn-helix domain-containing protein [Myxococcota bacterium]